MGNASSSSLPKNESTKSLSHIINYVASNYILTQNFNDMKNLSDMNYCNKLVIITSKILERNLDNLEVNYLSQVIKDGEMIDSMKKDNISYINKNNLNEIDINNQTQKRRVCIGIAKFYVKIANVFAAIVTTINPVYTYKDVHGNLQKTTLLYKTSIPNNVETKIEKFNLCSKRINSLINKQDYNVDNDKEIIVNPKFCTMNLNRTTGDSNTLESEPGIPELSYLYFDKYNHEQGGFTGMTEEMNKIYTQDVQKFYKIFTGSNEMPLDENGKPKIKTFKDILLKNYHDGIGCGNDGEYTKKYIGTLNDRLFRDYANHIKKMMQTANNNQNKLINLIDELFIFSLNPETGLKEIIINKKLTDERLQKVVEETREIIINLYLQCETDFLTGLKIFEAIVEKKIKDTSEAQIANLEKSLLKTKITHATKDEEQPIEQPFVQPIEQPIVQSIEQPIVQPIEQPIEQPIVQSIEQSIVQPIEQSIVQPIEQSIEKSIEKQVVQPIVQRVEEPMLPHQGGRNVTRKKYKKAKYKK